MRATPGRTPIQWRKSSYSGGAEGSECVEVATDTPNVVPVRDSKDPHGPVLTFTADAWDSFLTALKQNELPTV
ncbi:DUF397 domain-containing protein [Actinacidiphila acididurans]|uniref:DUF397 domain-containing protein n=1 Tax=Actinacidiphila acididurans TaxID=2784346 RepID=A0ABS2U0X1_9ACTN|nr:DUF397 domain-containing protein [Actinacidiphila acididurans]MBM9508846.1 DUF397 domain-containing protein [Actinacidiphila acididurans]